MSDTTNSELDLGAGCTRKGVNMSKHGYKEGGLRDKYIISKINGKPIDPEAEYFVLRYDVDSHARKALQVYADSVRDDNPELADDIINALSRTSNRFQYNQSLPAAQEE